MQKTIIALLGSAQAAGTAFPLTGQTSPKKDFPLYETVTVPSGTDLDTDNIKSTWATNNYRAHRTGVVVFPGQTLQGATQATAGSKSTVIQMANSELTFWHTNGAKAPTFPGKIDGTSATTATSSQATGYTWVACLSASAADSLKCNGGNTYNFTDKGTKAAGYAIAKRLMWVAGASAAITLPDSGSFGTVTWDQDILIASLYHPAWASATAVTDGSAWCSGLRTQLKTDGTTASIQASKGLTGHTKCSWILVTEKKTEGPTVKVDTADFANFYFQWIEWATTAGLGTNGVLNGADAADYFIGKYDTASTGPFLNPYKSGAGISDSGNKLQGSSLAWAFEERSQAVYPTGSIGTAAYYKSNTMTSWPDTIFTMDTAAIIDSVTHFKTVYDDNTKSVNDFNGKKTTYEKAVDDEKKRRADFFAAAFSPPISIPERPCAPTQPPAFMAPNLDLSVKTWKTTAKDQGTTAALKTGASAYVPDAKYNTRIGYYQVLADTTKATDLAYTGKVWGRLGQGAGNIPASATPFYWSEATSTMADGNSAGMVISAFPIAETDTGITDAAKFVKMTAKAVKWTDEKAYAAPARPAAAAAPKPGLSGAKMLAAGLISTAAAIVSLY